MAKALVHSYPHTPEDLHQKMRMLEPDEQVRHAKAWADQFVEKGLTPPAEHMWLLRQCFRYMPPTSIINYFGMNVQHTKPAQIEAFWLGTPVDWEGTVRMMEAAYSEKGWRAALLPSVRPGYSANQVARIMRLLQKTSDIPRKETVRTRESIFLEIFTEDQKNTEALQFWLKPHQWLNGHTLPQAAQVTIWCAYALLADPDLMLKVAKGLGWKCWEVGEFLLDWDAVTSVRYEERETAAQQLWSAQNKKQPKLTLPTNIDFSIPL